MSIETVAVTGGNGRIGGAIVQELNDAGYRTTTLNRGKAKNRVVKEDASGPDEYVQVQILDPGNVYAGLAKVDADAVVHMASIPNPLTNVGYETYQSNVMGTYHILEAASKLGLEAAIVPSSVNVIGGTFQDPPMDVRYLPVDEEHPVSPRDPYATSKHVIEITADSFARQHTDLRIASLRYPWVATTEEIEKTFAESDRSLDAVMANDLDFARDDLFAYLHLDDAAEIARAILETDFEGHERFWAAADDTTAAVDTSELVGACYPSADVTEEFDGQESLISTEKAQRMLDWEPTYSWVRK